jgi:hypothetical protein
VKWGCYANYADDPAVNSNGMIRWAPWLTSINTKNLSGTSKLGCATSSFPDTVQNETRFWRNLGNPAFNTPAKVGLGLIALFFFGTFGTWIIRIALQDAQWKQELSTIFLGLLVIFGPIFGAIAWATRRALRNAPHASKHRK